VQRATAAEVLSVRDSVMIVSSPFEPGRSLVPVYGGASSGRVAPPLRRAFRPVNRALLPGFSEGVSVARRWSSGSSGCWKWWITAGR
jgi:hypothetical protein